MEEEQPQTTDQPVEGPTETTDQPVEGPTGTIDETLYQPVEGTGAPEPSPEPTGPTYLISIDELLSEQAVIQQREAKDKSELAKIENPPDINKLRQTLIQWAAQGFPYAFPLFSITLNPPLFCSDGVQRSLYPYIEYVYGHPIATLMNTLETKLQGIKLLNSYSGTTITIHVFKV
jgi:hypothetical protein